MLMATSVYTINKGINKAIEFKGLKAQYIWYLGAVVVGLLLVFAALYFLGANQYLCIVVVGVLGAVGVTRVYRMSRKYGAYGLMKAMARRMVPEVVKSRDRKIFME